MSWYRVDFSLDDAVQTTLDQLYGYEHDITTKVLHRTRLNVFVSMLVKLAPPRGPALDVGCSAGAYASVLRDAGFDPVVGIDVDEAALAAARQAFPNVEFRRQPVEALDERSRYALILCTEVLEHLARPEEALDRVEAALRPGGLLVVSLPNAFSLPYAAMRLARRGTVDAEHLRYPFHRTLRLLDRPGLERVRTDGANLLLEPKLLRLVYGRRVFPLLNRVNFVLGRVWPLRYASQFFFVAARRVGDGASAIARA